VMLDLERNGGGGGGPAMYDWSDNWNEGFGPHQYGQHFMGPSSSNHWSDGYRSVEGNMALMSTSTFRNFYGLNDGYGGTNYGRAEQLANHMASTGSASVTRYTVEPYYEVVDRGNVQDRYEWTVGYKLAQQGGPDPSGCPPGVPCDQNKMQTQQAGLDGGEHLIGPTMVLLGQPIEILKPVGVLGSKPGSSIASYTLSKTITYSSPVIKQVTGTAVLGRALGRFVPLAGWALTAYDVWDNRIEIGTFLGGMRNSNQQNSYRKDGTWSTEWHVR
jgi:hypothetical protein